MTDTPELSDDKVAPLFPDRPSAAPLAEVQEDALALAKRVLEDVESGKSTGLMVILFARDGAAYSNSAGAITIAHGIAQLELFKQQLILQALAPQIFGRPK